MFDALCAHPYGLTINELIDWVYQDHVDGGPEWAQGCLWMQIGLLREDLRRTYPLLTVESARRSGRRYILVLKKELTNMSKSAKGKGKVGKVMHEFKHGQLHSGSKTGPKVTSRKQAVAIGLSEARKAGEGKSKKARNKRLEGAEL